MTFPLQAAPIHKIPKQLLDKLDITIRETTKGILGLTVHNTPNSMLYSPRKYRGLGLVCSRKEVLLQHFSISKRLHRAEDDLFQEVYDCVKEMDSCRQALGLAGESSKELREAYRESEFVNWSSMNYAGIGVKHFKNNTRSNRFMISKNNLSNSEWTAALKLICNYANLAGVPGTRKENNRCRRCVNEKKKETFNHVLGNCTFGQNRRNNRHHELKHKLNELIRSKNYYTMDEAFCIDESGSRLFIDILAFDNNSDMAYIIDPTIRFETNEDIDELILQEKRMIYEKCIEDLKKR